jgi:hypothetical protein
MARLPLGMFFCSCLVDLGGLAGLVNGRQRIVSWSSNGTRQRGRLADLACQHRRMQTVMPGLGLQKFYSFGMDTSDAAMRRAWNLQICPF